MSQVVIAILFFCCTMSVHAASSAVTKKINNYIQSERRAGRVASDERTAWYAWDLTARKEILSINATTPLQAASMIKPFVALAFFQRVKEGRIRYGHKSRAKLEASIQHSNNAATNWLMTQVGGPQAVHTILHRSFPRICKNVTVVEYIPKGGRTYANQASALDYHRFLKALWQGELPHSTEILRVMNLPGRDRLYSSTPIPVGTTVYNKTGSTARLCGDMGILVAQDAKGKKYAYIIVGVIEKSSRTTSYTSWMRSRGNVIRAVSTQVYEVLKQRYRLR